MDLKMHAPIDLAWLNPIAWREAAAIAEDQRCSLSSLTSQLTSGPTYICAPSPSVQVSQSKLAALAWAALAIQISLLNWG